MGGTIQLATALSGHSTIFVTRDEVLANTSGLQLVVLKNPICIPELQLQSDTKPFELNLRYGKLGNAIDGEWNRILWQRNLRAENSIFYRNFPHVRRV